MSRSSGRAQTEPLAALIALLAVVAAVGAYATLYDHTLPDPSRPAPTPSLERVTDTLTNGGVANPGRLTEAETPAGVALNVTLRAANETWTRGPETPPQAPVAARALAVRVGGQVVPGRLRVVVWS